MRLRQSTWKSSSDVEQIDRLVASSPYFLKLADWILTNLDRKTVAELIAGYLYFKSTGRSDADFTHFLLTYRLDAVLRIIGNSLPILVPAVFSDKEFRSLVVNVVMGSFANIKSEKVPK